MGDGFEQISETMPLGRAADPSKIAMTSGLRFEMCQHVSGAVVSVDGGRVAVYVAD